MLTPSDRYNLAKLATIRLAAAGETGDTDRANREGLTALSWYANHATYNARRITEHRQAGA